MLFSLISCAGSGEQIETTSAGTQPITGTSSPDESIEETNEETEVITEVKDGTVLMFSSAAAPTSLPNSEAKIWGEFIADFENPEDYW